MTASKGKGGTGKSMLAQTKNPVKGKIKKNSTVQVVTRVRLARLERQDSAVAFGALSILERPTYVAFAKPAGGKVGGRGCKSARVVLGPLVGVESQRGTDAKGKYPSAIVDVRKKIDDATYHWKSGHVINADFGGFGGSNENMTCLTSSANTSQTAFDNNIKRARSALHKFYSALRRAGQQKDFFTGLGYGIEINIEMSDDAWGVTYPRNCVSNSMSLDATIVGTPTEATIRTAMGGALESAILEVLGHLVKVQNLVDTANLRHTVTNVQ